MKLLCATSNPDKFGLGKKTLAKLGIELEQVVVDIDEIQGEDLTYIVEDKAHRAYETIGKPVVVTDDGWSIPALGGFPGAYMKSANHWFKPDDFLRLMHGVDDRRIAIIQNLAYCDEHETVVFSNSIGGVVAMEARGTYGPPIMKVVELDADEGMTISERYDEGIPHTDAASAKVWRELGAWLKTRER